MHSIEKWRGETMDLLTTGLFRHFLFAQFAMPHNYLHIWPRGKFMMIALPNQVRCSDRVDGKFEISRTCLRIKRGRWLCSCHSKISKSWKRRWKFYGFSKSISSMLFRWLVRNDSWRILSKRNLNIWFQWRLDLICHLIDTIETSKHIFSVIRITSTLKYC